MCQNIISTTWTFPQMTDDYPNEDDEDDDDVTKDVNIENQH